MNIVKSEDTDRDDDGYIFYQGLLFTGIEEWYYDTGELGTTTEYVNGVPNGYQRGWYKSGVQRSERPYVNGCIQGVVRKWYENGQLQLEQEIRQGKTLWLSQWKETGEPTTNSKVDNT